MLAPLRGHRRQQALLRGQIEANRLPHALCFAGPPGIGKRTVADAAVAFDFCENRGSDGLGACGQCTACKKLASRNHPDLVRLEPENQSLKIDQVREVFQQVRFHPLYAKRRWILIDCAQSLTEQAQNALLHTLEEPHAQTHFILIVDSFDRLLQTVRSRCQLLRFSPLSNAEVRGVLDALAVPPEQVRDLVPLANGSPGRGLELAQDDLLSLRREVLEALKAIALNTADRDQALTLLRLSQDLSGHKAFRPFILEVMQTFFRDLAAASLDLPQSAWVNQDLFGELTSPRPIDLHQAVDGYRLARQLEQDFRVNVNPELAYNRLLFDITAVFHGAVNG